MSFPCRLAALAFLACVAAGCSDGYECNLDTDCEGTLVCRNGRCVSSSSSCDGVVCDEPPDSCHEPAGTCSEGQCLYAPLEDGAGCDDGDACTTADACQQGACAGTPVVCESPPASTCVDDHTLRSWSGPGECEDGECRYPQENTECADGCDVDHCIGCTPDCSGKCGGAADGCGGRCNAACPAGRWCDGGACRACDSTRHCGQGCVDCNAAIQNATGARCENGTCDYEACESGFTDCDENRSNGCELTTAECNPCADCGPDQVCYENACCTPAACGEDSCGEMDDGCGGSPDCGECPDPDQACEANACVCHQETCAGDCCAVGHVCYMDETCNPNADPSCEVGFGDCDEDGTCECDFHSNYRCYAGGCDP